MALAYSPRVSDPFTLTAGQTGPLTQDWILFSSDDIEVRRRRAGVIEDLVVGIDFTVSGVGDQDGFAVNLLAGAEEGDEIVLLGAREVSRDTTITSERAVTPTLINKDFDIVYAQMQEATREGKRSFKTSLFDPNVFDLEGRRLQNIGDPLLPGDAVNLNSIQQALADATSDATATAVAAAGTATGAAGAAAAAAGSASAAADAAGVAATAAGDAAGDAASAAGSASGAQTAAEEARDAAIAAAAAASAGSGYATISLAAAATPETAPAFMRVEGYATAGDGGGALYKMVGAEPTHDGKYFITLEDGVTVAWYEIAEPVIRPEMLGAQVNAGADQSAFLSSTFDVANAIKSKVYFSAGTWRQDVTIDKGYALEIELHPEAIIDIRAKPASGYAWTFSGSYGAAYNVSATAASSVTVSPSDAANFAFGDYVIIRSADIYDASRTSSKIGETNRVQSVNVGTGVIALSVPLRGNYSTSPVIERPTWIRGGIVRGGQFLANDGLSSLNSGKAGLSFTLGRDCIVENVAFTRFDDRAIRFVDCIDAHANGNNIRRARSSGTAYAISFQDCCQDCGADGNFVEDVRHALSTNNSAVRGGIPRRITFAKNHVFISASAVSPGSGGGDAIDTHAAAEHIKISDNTVIGSSGNGINVECSSCEVVGNTIIDSATNGISVHNESDAPGSAVVARNVIKGCGARGIYLLNGTSGTSAVYTSAIVAENIIDTVSSAGIQVNPASSPAIQGLVLIGNRVRNSTGRCIDVANVEGAVISQNSSKGPGSTQAMSVRNAVNTVISSNVATQPAAAASAAFQLTAASAGASIANQISGNRFGVEPGGTMTGSGIAIDNNGQYNGVHGNNVRQSGGIALGTGTGNAQANNIT